MELKEYMIKDFEYGLCTDDLRHRRAVCEARSALRDTWADEGLFAGGKEGYLSIYTFPAGYIKQVQESGESAGYEGEVSAEFLIFDIDNAEDLPAAQADAVKLANHLISLGFDRNNIQFFWSGNSGFHGAVQTAAFFAEFTVTPSASFATVLRNVAKKIADGAGVAIDLKVYNYSRVMRCANTRNPKSGLNKIPLTYENVTQWDIETIKTRAQRSRKLVEKLPGENVSEDDVLFVPVSEPLPKLVEIWREEASRTANASPKKPVNRLTEHAEKSFTNASDPAILKRAIAYLDKLPPAKSKHGGHNTLLSVVCKLVHGFNLSPDDTKTLLWKYYNPRCVPPWSEAELMHKIEAAMKKTDSKYPPGYLLDGPRQVQTDTGTPRNNRRNPDDFEPFPLECLPEKFAQYVEQKSKALNQNPAGLAMALLAQVGAHIGCAVKIKLGNDRSAAPILWLALVNISGGGKTPLLKAGIDMILEREKVLFQEHRLQMVEYEKQCKDYERQVKQQTRRREQFSEILPTPDEPPQKPKRRKLYVSGATIEGLHKDIMDNPRGMLLFYDELAVYFGDTERGNKSGGTSEWLSGHSGESVNSSRKSSSEIFIPEAWWTVVGGSTPERLESIMRSGYRVSDGTLSRFILVWPPENEVMSNEDVSPQAVADMKAILDMILNIDFHEGCPYIVSLSEEAKVLWQEWKQEIFDERKTKNTDTEASFLSKSGDTLPRIALILHVLEAARIGNFFGGLVMYIQETLSAETFRKAETITRWAMTETEACYRRFGFIRDPTEEGHKPCKWTEKVLGILQEADTPVTAAGIVQRVSRFRTEAGRKQLDEILARLTQEGRILREELKSANNVTTESYALVRE